MTAPYLHLGFYDPRRDGESLREAARVYLAIAGADVGPPSWRLGPGTALAGDDRPATLELVAVERGGLAQLVVSLGELAGAPRDAWVAMYTAALDLAAGVRPVLATIAVEEPPDGIVDPSWPGSSRLFEAGWADPERFGPAQRLRFANLAAAGIVTPYGGGLAWGVDEVLRPGRPRDDDWRRRRALAAAVFEAWTGRAAPPPADDPHPAPDAAPDAAPDVAVPEVWWWTQDGEPENLRERLAAELPEPVKPYVGPGDPGWQAVVCELAPGAAAHGLDLVRRTAATAGASWIAVQPAGGLAVPGMDPDLPMTGVLVNPWVSRAWAGEALPQLEAVFAGAHREEVADGVLWVTDTRLADVADPSWGDDDTRWDRLVAAAGVLAQVARRSA
jgi:hypothetical protein